MFEDAVPALEAFIAVLGLDSRKIPEWEGAHRILFEEYNLPASPAGGLEICHIQRLSMAFGESLSFQFKLHNEDLDQPGDHREILAFPGNATEADVETFHKRAVQVTALEFSLKIDKKKLLQRERITAQDVNFILYLYPAALTRFLRGENVAGMLCSAYDSLKMLEDTLWHAGKVGLDEMSVIMVLDHDIHLQGDYLALIGGKYLDQWREIKPVLKTTPGLPQLTETRRNNVLWDNGWLTRLTPPKLKINEVIEGKDDPMVAALRSQLFNLVVLFTASRVAGVSGDWIATYSSSSGTGDVLLHAPAREQIEPRLLDKVDAFYEIFAWAYYSNWPRDRIAFVHGTLAEELMHSPHEGSGRLLLERAEMLKTGIQRRWDSFIGEQLHAYSEDERALEDAVMETVDAFTDRVAAMGKSVSDAMLAAIAAVLGSFVAAGFGTDAFNPGIFRVGMIAYSLYVLLFPFLYLMRAQWVQYKMLKDGIRGRMDRLSDKLTRDRMAEIAGTRIEQADRNFRFWFWITVGIYILVILAGFTAAFVVPMFVSG